MFYLEQHLLDLRNTHDINYKKHSILQSLNLEREGVNIQN